MSTRNNYLIISDLQLPYTAKGALDFCVKVAREYKCNEILCAGDETDQYFASRYPKDPNSNYSAVQELHDSIKELKRWYKAFPKMKIAISNHAVRYHKRATDAEIPAQVLRSYAEIIEAPPGWVWRQDWRFNEDHKFRLVHGCGYSGPNGAKNAAIDGRISTAIGHLHSFGGVNFIANHTDTIWAMNVGCLIDVESFAFEYGKTSRSQPTLGVGVVVDSGHHPIFVPYKE